MKNTPDEASLKIIKGMLKLDLIICCLYFTYVDFDEWATMLRKKRALFSMDALCAIVTPDFNKSKWCDQEVGIAIGSNKMVFAIDKGEVPYGFFGKYQDIKSKGKSRSEVAKDVYNSILNNEKTQSGYINKLIALTLNVKSIDDANNYLKNTA